MLFGFPPPSATPNSPANNTSKPGNWFMKTGQFLAHKVTQLFPNDLTSTNKIASLVLRVCHLATSIFSASPYTSKTPSSRISFDINRSAPERPPNRTQPPTHSSLAFAAAPASSARKQMPPLPKISPMSFSGNQIELASKRLSSANTETDKETATATLLQLITKFNETYPDLARDIQYFKDGPDSDKDARVIAFAQVEAATKLLSEAPQASVKTPAPPKLTPMVQDNPSLPRAPQQTLAAKSPAAPPSPGEEMPSLPQISPMVSLGAEIESAGEQLSSAKTEEAKTKARHNLFELIHLFQHTENVNKPGFKADQASYATALSQVKAATLLLEAPNAPVKTPRVDSRGVIDVPGDGSCLYHSMTVGLQLLLPKLQTLGLPKECILPADRGTIPDASALRTLANNYIRAHHATSPVLQRYVSAAIAAANDKYKKDLKNETASINSLLNIDPPPITQADHDQRLAAAAHQYRPIKSPEEYFERAMDGLSFWGSQAEFYALSKLYQTTIQIIEDDGDALIRARDPVNPEYLEHHAAVRLVMAGGHFNVMQLDIKVPDIKDLSEERQKEIQITLAAEE